MLYFLRLGLPSKEVQNLIGMKNHIIVFGNCSCVHMLIPELRRPAVRGETYHPLVIVDKEEPPRWNAIKERFNDVYFLRGSLTRSAAFNAANIEDAFAVMLFANKEKSTLMVSGCSRVCDVACDVDRLIWN